MGIEIKYPLELYIDESEKKIVFDFVAPDDPAQKLEYSVLNHFNISFFENKDFEQYKKDYKLSESKGFKQEQIKIGDVSLTQVSYENAFSGNIVYSNFIKKGSDLIVIHYFGETNLEKTFNEMLSTIEIIQ